MSPLESHAVAMQRARGLFFSRCAPLREQRHGAFSFQEAHHFASGDMRRGWSQMKVGLTHSSSRNSPTSLSSSRAVVCGGAQSSLCSLHCSHKGSRCSRCNEEAASPQSPCFLHRRQTDKRRTALSQSPGPHSAARANRASPLVKGSPGLQAARRAPRRSATKPRGQCRRLPRRALPAPPGPAGPPRSPGLPAARRRAPSPARTPC
jgi:hypothetical protein